MRNFAIGAVAGLAAGILIFLVVGRVGTHHAQEQHAAPPPMSATAALQPLSPEATAKLLALPPPGTGETPRPGPGETPRSGPGTAPTAGTGAPAAKPTASAPAPAQGAAPAPAAAAPAAAGGDDLVAQGEKVFTPCKACHTLEAGGADRLGPNLHGLFGRKSGTKPGYKYSEAMAKAGVVWDERQLDTYMANPKSFIPGNRMAFPGVPKPENRAALIAFLKQATK